MALSSTTGDASLKGSEGFSEATSVRRRYLRSPVYVYMSIPLLELCSIGVAGLNDNHMYIVRMKTPETSLASVEDTRREC